MGILTKLFGFRWSLYVVKNDNELVYALHENSVYRILFEIKDRYAKGKEPVPPWSLVLNFNHTHKSIKLRRDHFTTEGTNISEALFTEIEAIDPGWEVKSVGPIFEEVATRKRLKIAGNISPEALLKDFIQSMDKPPEASFYSVMREVFGR